MHRENFNVISLNTHSNGACVSCLFWFLVVQLFTPVSMSNSAFLERRQRRHNPIPSECERTRWFENNSLRASFCFYHRQRRDQICILFKFKKAPRSLSLPWKLIKECALPAAVILFQLLFLRSSSLYATRLRSLFSPRADEEMLLLGGCSGKARLI